VEARWKAANHVIGIKFGDPDAVLGDFTVGGDGVDDCSREGSKGGVE